MTNKYSPKMECQTSNDILSSSWIGTQWHWLRYWEEYSFALSLSEKNLQNQQIISREMETDWSSVSHYLSPASRCLWPLTQRFKTHNPLDYDNFLVTPASRSLDNAGIQTLGHPQVTPGSQYRPDNEMRKIRFVVAIFRAGPRIEAIKSS